MTELAIKANTAPSFVQLLQHSYLQHGREAKCQQNTQGSQQTDKDKCKLKKKKSLCSPFCDSRKRYNYAWPALSLRDRMGTWLEYYYRKHQAHVAGGTWSSREAACCATYWTYFYLFCRKITLQLPSCHLPYEFLKYCRKRKESFIGIFCNIVNI